MGKTSSLALAALAGLAVSLPPWAGLAGLLSFRSALGLAIALTALSAALVWRLARSQRDSLAPLREALRRVAEEGDLTVQSPPLEGEAAGLADGFNALVEHLRQVYVGLGQAVAMLEANVGTLRDQLQAQTAGTLRQAANLQQAQVIAEEIRVTCLAADRRAHEVLKATNEAAQAGLEGGQALARGRDRLGAINGQVADMRAQVGTLPARMRQIESIVDTVKDLADQSSLLALNAGIEALRAGEHGRGFALVAREVRSLADQSVRSTQRIRDSLDAVLQSVAEADRSAGESAGKVREGLEQVAVTSTALERVAALVQDDAQAARLIAEAVRQQAEGVNQIFLALNDQTRMMDETRRQAETSAGAVEPLEKLALRISKLVQRFNVN